MVYGLLVLLPACATDSFLADYNAKQTDPKNKLVYDTFDVLSMGNISVRSSHLVAGCLIFDLISSLPLPANVEIKPQDVAMRDWCMVAHYVHLSLPEELD